MVQAPHGRDEDCLGSCSGGLHWRGEGRGQERYKGYMGYLLLITNIFQNLFNNIQP